MFKKIAGALVAVAPLASFAQGGGGGDVFDAGQYATNITGLTPGMLAIGGAVFLLILAIKSTKWGRRAL